MYTELVDEEQETEPELNLAEEIKTKKLTTSNPYLDVF